MEACLAVPFQAGRDRALLGLEVLEPVDGEVLAVLEAAAAALQELVDALPAAARVATPPTRRLAHAFEEVAVAVDAQTLLERTARALGDLLELDVVQVALGRRGSLGAPSAWRRTRRDGDLVLPRARFVAVAESFGTACRRRPARPAPSARPGGAQRCLGRAAAGGRRGPRGLLRRPGRAAASRRWSGGSARR